MSVLGAVVRIYGNSLIDIYHHGFERHKKLDELASSLYHVR